MNGSGGYYPGHGYTKSNIAFVKKDMVNFGCPYKPSQFVLAPKGGDKDNAYADEAVLAYIGLREGSRIEFGVLFLESALFIMS